jgi:hypothetical protein
LRKMMGPVLHEIGDYVPIEWVDMPVKNQWTMWMDMYV